MSFLGFWSKHPDIPAQLRKGHIAVEGEADVLANVRIVHGNSGAPVWRLSDGKVIGTAQKNLFDQINLEQPLAGQTAISSYADLVVVTALDKVLAWLSPKS